MRGFIVAVTAGAALLAATPAGAQSPSYGGGLLPSAVPPRGYTPTMGIVLQPRGGTIALRFDTTLLCGNVVYDAAGRATVPFDGRSFAAAAARQFSIGTHRGNRVVFRWTLSGQVDGTIASGRLRITGRRFVDGRRTSCRHKPVREFLARISGPAATGAPAPPPRAAFGGTSEIRVDNGRLAPRTYTARRHSGDGFAGFDLTGMGRGCNTIEATFTIHEIAFDPGDILRTLRVDFEQHCEGAAAALRGTWNFKAA